MSELEKESALAQIKSKKYADKYMIEGERNICGLEYENHL